MINIIYKDMCPYCDMAKWLMDSLWIEYNAIDYTWEFDKIVDLSIMTGMRTIPQIFNWDVSRENLIWGYTELKQLVDEWKLEDLIK